MSDRDVRERILEVATRLFARKGYGSTPVREVVEAAGVTKPTLYYYFQNKEALFIEAVKRQMNGYTQDIADATSWEGPIAERLRRILRAYIARVTTDTDGIWLMMTAHLPPRDGQPPIDVLSVHRQHLALMTRILEEAAQRGEIRADVCCEDAVRALLGSANMFVKSALAGDQPREGDADRLLDIFLNGVTPR